MFRSLLFLLLSAWSFTTLAEDEKADTERGEIPVKIFYYSLGDQFISQLSAALQDQAVVADFNLLQFDAGRDAEKQFAQLKRELALSKDQAPVLVNPVDAVTGGKILKEAELTSTPVIMFNRMPDPEIFAASKAWFVGSNSANAGMLQAEIVADYFQAFPECDKNGDGKIKTVIICGEKDLPSDQRRLNAFFEKAAERGLEIDVAASFFAEWDQNKAKDRFELLSDHGEINLEGIELIVSGNDAMALGALSVLRDEGYNRPNRKGYFIPVVGLDAIPSALSEVRRGCMIGTLSNDVESAATALLSLAQGFKDKVEISSRIIGYKVPANRILNIPFMKILPDERADGTGIRRCGES